MNTCPFLHNGEPESRRLSADDLRARLMVISRDIKDTKIIRKELLRHLAETKPVGNILLNPSELWVVSMLDNRVVGLMRDATVTATGLSDTMRGA